MRLAVIIPVFNEENIIHKLLTDLEDQDLSHHKYTIILVDNNSSDKTIKIAKDFFNTHEFLDHKIIKESKQGIPAARMAGYKFAQKHDYEVLVNFDADTRYPSNILSYIYQVFSDKDVDYLIGQQYFPKEVMLDLLVSVPDLLKYNRHFYKLEHKYFGPRFFGPYSAIRTNFFNKLDYDIDNPLLPYEDVHLSRRCYYSGGKHIKSKVFVTSSARRVTSDVKSWLSGTRIDVEKVEKSHQEKGLEFTKLSNLEIKKIKQNRLEFGVNSFANLITDCLLFSIKHPEFKMITHKIIKKVAKEILSTEYSQLLRLAEMNKYKPMKTKDAIMSKFNQELYKNINLNS